MSLFYKANFFTTANQWKDLPPEGGVEVAFAGRSNAGKSSAINVLTNRKRLAFASKTPGRTQHINFFSLGEEPKFLVDLPGYGYAEVPHSVKQHWQAFLSQYLASRNSLRGLVVLMDIRHPLTPLDRQLLEWYFPSGKPLVILLTKADKLGRGGRLKAVREVRDALPEISQPIEVIAFSSTSREGLEEARATIEPLFLPEAEHPDKKMPSWDEGKRHL